MQITFDLISDLHLETWREDINWQGQATSPMCIVAGDIARDRDLVVKKLEHLASCYRMTFYIDGNDEHKYYMDNLPNSYRDLVQRLKSIKNLQYLHDNVVVVNGVAILATNGWFGFDFDPSIDSDWAAQCWKAQINGGVEPDPEVVSAMSRSDCLYLKKSVHRLQRHRDVKKILLITHTVPRSDLVDHDISLANNWRYNVIGNSLMHDVLNYDTENKIHTWCFGHYHGSVDRILDGVRYVNNCRGREDTEFKQIAYYPKRITIDT